MSRASRWRTSIEWSREAQEVEREQEEMWSCKMWHKFLLRRQEPTAQA